MAPHGLLHALGSCCWASVGRMVLREVVRFCCKSLVQGYSPSHLKHAYPSALPLPCSAHLAKWQRNWQGFLLLVHGMFLVICNCGSEWHENAGFFNGICISIYSAIRMLVPAAEQKISKRNRMTIHSTLPES